MLWGGCYCIPSTDESEETVAQRGRPASLLRGAPRVHSLNFYALLLAAGCWLRGRIGEERRWWTQRIPCLILPCCYLSPWGWHTHPKCCSPLWHPFLSSQALTYLLNTPHSYSVWFEGLAGEHSSWNTLHWRVFLLYLGSFSSLAEPAALEDPRGRTGPQETLLIGREMLVPLPISELSFSLTNPLNAYALRLHITHYLFLKQYIYASRNG